MPAYILVDTKIENAEFLTFCLSGCVFECPDFAAAHFNTGNCYLNLKKYPEAVVSFKEALKHNVS